MFTALLAGLGLCLSIIAAPGAQNVFLLREGIRHSDGTTRHPIVLAIICLACDVVLVSAGVGGFGIVVEEVPWLFDAARWAGVVFLAGYGLLAAWRAFRGGSAIDVGGEGHARGGSAEVSADAGTLSEDPAYGNVATATIVARAQRTRGTLLPAVLTCLAITWLNPHTYLDTVLLLGSISTTYGDARWFFAVGAILGSAVWFAILTFGARAAARWMGSPRSWRILDAAVAVLMLGLATALAFG